MIDLTMAHAAVSDIAIAETWYRRVLDSSPHLRPMDGLIEWRFGPAHGLQVFHDPDRAGNSTVVVGVVDLDDVVERLVRVGVDHGGVQEGGGGHLVVLADPDDNQVVLLDPDAAHGRTVDGPVARATMHFERRFPAAAAVVWDAYADIAQRSVWSVPKGEVVEYDASDFVVGGTDVYRCGPPDDLASHVTTRYGYIDAPRSLVATSEISRDGTPVSIDTTHWSFDADGDSTNVSIVVQVTSLVGAGMLDGYRNGHERTLDHLGEFLA
ncbi:MAG: hypothetical protein R8G01_15160 [Ilumatobacteraceae bacterium]|nr:hypothetical protein [Ilumatobacteraceae bacterium]